MSEDSNMTEIELEEETYATAQVLADELGISVEELINHILRQAVNNEIVDNIETV